MNICVFSSSSNAIHRQYTEAACDLGTRIGAQGMTLISGGANVGLMEVVSTAVVNNGGKTIGVIPEKLHRYKLASDNSHELIVTRDMMDRKARMRELADAFIALPGGFGTLEEILEVITLKQLSYHNKPIVFVNTVNFYQHLFAQFEMAYEEQFAKEGYRKLYHIADTPKEALDYISAYKPAEMIPKWFNV